jgi:hypothetical protein
MTDVRLNRAIRHPPTCRRLPPDFALFPSANGIRPWPNRRSSPKSAKSGGQSYRPSLRHVGGTGSKDVLSDRRVRHDFAQIVRTHKGIPCRTNSSIEGKSAAAIAAIHRRRATRDDCPCYTESLRVSDSAAATPLARTQKRLPMVLIREQPLKRLTPVRRLYAANFDHTGNFRLGRARRLNQQP